MYFISMFYFELGGRSAFSRCGHFAANRALARHPYKLD
jgi:hypothetical protein